MKNTTIIAAFALVGCTTLPPVETQSIYLRVYESPAAVECMGALACEVAGTVVLPGDDGLLCDQPVTVHVYPWGRNPGPGLASYNGEVHTSDWGSKFDHPRINELGRALQEACGVWKPASESLWGHEGWHAMGRSHD